jgi:hypothetical protein
VGPRPDAALCPPPDQVRKDGACSPSFLSCPSVENKIPACLAGYEPTTCHCLSAQWSCDVYAIACPDAGRLDSGWVDGEHPDTGPIILDARPNDAPLFCDGPSCVDASSVDASSDVSTDASDEL